MNMMKTTLFFLLFIASSISPLTSSASPVPTKGDCKEHWAYCNQNDMSGTTIAWNEYLYCVGYQTNITPCAKEAENVVAAWNVAVDYCQKCYGIDRKFAHCDTNMELIQCLPKLPAIKKG